MSFNAKLADLLKTDSRFLDEDGEIVVAAVQDCAWRLDDGLVSLLLNAPEMRAKFFREIEGHWIFDAQMLVQYISRKNFLDNSYTRFRNRIGLTAGGKYFSELGDVALAWPYKDCVLEGGQTGEEKGRREIFFNEILAEDEITRLLSPKAMTDFVRHTALGKAAAKKFARDKNGVLCENLIINGNNLLALHTIRAQFYGRIKMVYIDPPYNTGGDANIFTYNNNFNHSAWLVFMKNRLEVARELLTEDGFIAIAIDHTELFYLGALADEIFGRENRLGVVSVVIKPEGRQFAKFFSVSNEYMLVYAKSASSANFQRVVLTPEKDAEFNIEDEKGKYKLRRYINYNKVEISGRHVSPSSWYPFYVSPDLSRVSLEKRADYLEIWPVDKGVEKTWQTKKDKAMSRLNDGDIVCAKNAKDEPEIYYKDRPGQRYLTHWNGSRHNTTRNGTRLLNGMMEDKTVSYPKSIYTVLDTLKIMTDKDDIILDFFAGSGTTAHAVLELNKEDGGDRKFILVEQLREHVDICKERTQKVMAKNAIKDSFVYCELMKYNQIFMDEIRAAESGGELLEIWRKMSEHSFLKWYVNGESPDDAAADFAALGGEDDGLKKQKRLLAEMLDKNQLYVNLSEMEDAQFNVSDDDKRLNRDFQGDAADE